MTKFGERLQCTPKDQWVELAEEFWEGYFSIHVNDNDRDEQYECILRFAENLEKGNLAGDDCCREFGVSRRHLQRQFISFFGMTIRDYERIIRFYEAFCQLDETSLSETAMQAGYYDQSHMNRDFKQMSGTSPGQATEHSIYPSLKEVCKKQRKKIRKHINSVTKLNGKT